MLTLIRFLSHSEPSVSFRTVKIEFGRLVQFRMDPCDFGQVRLILAEFIKTLVIITWAWNSFEVRRMHLTINTVFFSS